MNDPGLMNMRNEHGHRKGTQVPLLLLLLSGGARALTPSVRAPWHLQHAAAALPARHSRHCCPTCHRVHVPSEEVFSTMDESVRPRISGASVWIRSKLMRGVIAWSAVRRHTQARREMASRAVTEDHANDDAAARVTWAGAAVNFALAILKAVAGVVGGSTAMIADAGHSFSDLLTDGLTILTLRMSALPADIDHPYGHGKFESLGSLFIAGFLVLAGTSFGANAYSAIRNPVSSSMGAIALWAAVASILSKEILARATERVGRRLKSPVLVANAWHHRSDALSSVVALVGIGGALLGIPILDPLAGLVVAGMLSWMGACIGVDALVQLSDTSDFAVAEEVGVVARKVPGVMEASEIRTRSMGASWLVDLAIQVDERLSASAAHRIAEEVRFRVKRDATDVSEVLVHVETEAHCTADMQTDQILESRSHIDVVEGVRDTLRDVDGVAEVADVQVMFRHHGCDCGSRDFGSAIRVAPVA